MNQLSLLDSDEGALLGRTIQLDAFAAIQERDKGMEVAEANAEINHPGWKKQAYAMFQDWLSGWPTGYQFLIEDFRKSAQIRGLPDPPSARSFGGMALKAKFAGLIKSVDLAKTRSKSAHGCFSTLWQKL